MAILPQLALAVVLSPLGAAVALLFLVAWGIAWLNER